MAAEKLGISGFNLLGEGASFQDTLFDMLAESQLFSRFEGHEIRQMAEYMHAYSVDAGVTVFPEGMHGNCMALLVSGKIEVLKNDKNDQPHPIAVITAGKTFGEMSLIDGQPYSASTRTVQPSTIVLITRDNFMQCVQRHPALGVKLLMEIARLLSMRLRQTSGQLADMLGG